MRHYQSYPCHSPPEVSEARGCNWKNGITCIPFPYETVRNASPVLGLEMTGNNFSLRKGFRSEILQPKTAL